MASITPIPAFNDNYFWLIQPDSSDRVYVIDPGDATVVEAALALQNQQLAGILLTHHHADHTGGVAGLTEHRNIPVYGPENSAFSGISHPVSDNDTINLDGLIFQVIATPGHTLDHIAYFSNNSDQPLLFCGDTLFAGGCGRLFEGTPQQMHDSLTRLAALPQATRMFCAHEYTLANLSFAAAVEPENPDIQQRIVRDTEARDRNQPTIPSTIALELATNPFLRCLQPAVITAAEHRSGSELPNGSDVLRVIRAWKDNF